MAERRMLIDTSKCIGCRGCQIACQQWHQLPAEDTSFTGSYQNPEDLSAANLTLTRFSEMVYNDDLRWLFFVDRCRHCKDPMCKEACPLKAITVFKKGPSVGWVVINSKCDPAVCSTDEIKPCQVYCPFKTQVNSYLGIPRYRRNNGSPLPDGKANKCDFCYDRWRNATLKAAPYNGKFAKSKKPACQLACPTGAISTGEFVKMRRKANRRVRYLQANGYPAANRYPNGLVTHVLWVLLEDRAYYGIVDA
jgi:formate dehydrogenase iron-sulfur subunit